MLMLMLMLMVASATRLTTFCQKAISTGTRRLLLRRAPIDCSAAAAVVEVLRAQCQLFNAALAQHHAMPPAYRTYLCKKTENFTLCVKDNDTTKTVIIKIVVLQSWHIFTRTRTIAMFYLKCKIVRTCDFCDRNPLQGFKINSR